MQRRLYRSAALLSVHVVYAASNTLSSPLWFGQLCPENAEEYIDYLHSVGRLDEAAVRLAAVVNDESFVSKEGKSNYQVSLSFSSCIISTFILFVDNSSQ